MERHISPDFPKFWHGNVVEYLHDGRRFSGEIRCVSHGWTPSNLQPKYIVLPLGKKSLSEAHSIEQERILRLSEVNHAG